jgi:hypothetical protein
MSSTAEAPLASWRDTATTRAMREVDDRGGADKVLGAGSTEISVRGDWATVFAD